jgi:hypothetical protein
VYITGVEDGPGLFEAMELIGKKRCLERIDVIVRQSEGSHVEK